MSTYFILLDAFRWDYVSECRTPNIYSLSTKSLYVKKVQQSLGFCERSEIFTGQSGVESRFITAIKYDSANAEYSSDIRNGIVYRVDKLMLRFQKRLGVKQRFFSRLRKFVRRRLLNVLYVNGNFKMNIYEIPSVMLSSFSLSEDLVDHRLPNALNTKSLFDFIRDNEMSYEFGAFTSLSMTDELQTDELRFVHTESMVGKKYRDLHLIYITAADKYGHLYGPSSEKFLVELRALDKRVGDFVSSVMLKDEDAKFVLLGDHGMTDVNKLVNLDEVVTSYFENLGLEINKHYKYFLDSTICRVWLSEGLDSSVLSGLQELSVFLENGVWIDEKNSEKYSIFWPNREYGDCLWLANPGVLISPDFFNGAYVPKGMHGYDPSHQDSYGMCIYYNKKNEPSQVDKIKLHEVYSILKSAISN